MLVELMFSPSQKEIGPHKRAINYDKVVVPTPGSAFKIPFQRLGAAIQRARPLMMFASVFSSTYERTSNGIRSNITKPSYISFHLESAKYHVSVPAVIPDVLVK